MPSNPSLPIEIAAVSDMGLVRSDNEDSYLVYLPPVQEAEALGVRAVAVVADGMGGHALGERASVAAVKAFTEGLFSALMRKQGPMEQALQQALQYANDAVLRLGDEASKGRPGTTLTALILTDDSFYITHIGDSRAYLFRDNQMRQLTDDHTWVAQEVAEGRMKPEEAKNSPFGNYLTRALGAKEKSDGDVIAGGLREGDLFLLCSDGLTTVVTDAEILEALKDSPSLQLASGRLVSLAHQRGSPDNITLIAVQLGTSPTLHLQTSKQTEIVKPFPLPIAKPTKIPARLPLWLLLLIAGAFIGLTIVLFSLAKPQNKNADYTPPPVRPQMILAPRQPPPIPNITLTVQLQPDGLLIVAEKAALSAKPAERKPEQIGNDIFLPFRNPKKSYQDLTSKSAYLLLRTKTETLKLDFGSQRTLQVTISPGQWDLLYLTPSLDDIHLCTIAITPVQ
ncbi:MAG: protein phosphatase 2C domain-containing protein [Armatimonadetes bacterium]|nr:protein phosphatase 2C domain-containing protein [Armatimonadota bacterium]MDW8121039.1 protein phosphatase 2C domain-containing protein [Armatimonadota bacterium]